MAGTIQRPDHRRRREENDAEEDLARPRSRRRRSARGSGKAYAADLTVWGLQAFNPAADAYIGELVEGIRQGRRTSSAEYVVVPANVLNEKLAAAFAAGAPPDAFMKVSAQGLYYMSQGLTAPLDDVLADMRKVPGGIYENTMPQAIYDGQGAGAADRGRRFADVSSARICSPRSVWRSRRPG